MCFPAWRAAFSRLVLTQGLTMPDDSAGAIPTLRSSDTLKRGRVSGCYESINAGAEVGEGLLEDSPKERVVDAATVQGTLTAERVFRALAYGMVNGILLSPVSVSFAAIIFRDPAFVPHLPRLVKLVMFSGGVHAACFAALSGLEFAVGSVQDAGLIFLSAIASMLVRISREEGLDEAAMLSTVCVVLSACTAMLGLALVFLGRLRLASLVQHLPMPVVGGYLAFIGYFCGQAGLGFATGLEITCIEDLGKLADSESLILVTPAVLGGVVYYLCLRRFSSPITLPLLMAMFVGIFFAVLAATGTSLEEARSLKWVSPESRMLPLTRAWDVFSLADVHWGAIIRVLPNFLAMTVVVAFSSCLDVAAVEMEMGMPLNFDRELQTVGWSNVISGLLGGFTGSYIFSQTIFNLRSGVDTRLAGATTSFIIVAATASPASFISYLPRAFFGSLLVLISVDLMVEWLWQARLRMMTAEYMVCLATFGAIQAGGVEKGMAAGLVLAAVSFTITYAQVATVMTARVKASTVMRTFEERVILQARRQQTLVLELQGYIFFGSAAKILADVKERIVWGGDHPGAVASTGIIINKDGGSGNLRAADTDSPTPRRSSSAVRDSGSLSRNSGVPTASRAPKSPLTSARRRSLASTRQDDPQPHLLLSNLLSNMLSSVYNRSGITLFPPASKSRAPDSQMRVEVSPRSRENSRREHSEQQQHLLQPGSTFLSYTAGTGAATTVGTSGGRVWQSLKRRLSSEGRDGRRRSDMGIIDDSEFTDDSEGTDSGGKHYDVRASTPLETVIERRVDDAEEKSCLMIDRGVARLGEDRAGGAEGAVASVGSAKGLNYGAVEDGGYDGYSGERKVEELSSVGGDLGAGKVESRDGVMMDGAVQTYTSLWANGGCPATNDRSRRLSSVVPLLPRPERRTRRVVLDFSNVVGVDATAARSCFLFLKMLLRTSGVEMVFSGANRKVQSLLKSHGVITDEDEVFDSLDTALEWSEEMVLNERKIDTLRHPVIIKNGSSAGPAASSCSSVDPSALSLPRPLKPWKTPTPRVTESHPSEDDGHRRGEDNGGTSPVLASVSERAEAAAFLGHHEDYYARAGSLRRRSATNARTAHAGGKDGVMAVGNVGSLQCILEDYLEVDRYQVPESIRSVLRETHRFFRQENVAANAVLMDITVPPEKIFFIGAGSVELQVVGELGARRLLRVCAGGTFGEVGFYLRTPQAFRAIAMEPCHLHTLDREGMGRMQRENPGLCVLVQTAVLKSICLAASFSMEPAHLGPTDYGGSGQLASDAEEND